MIGSRRSSPLSVATVCNPLVVPLLSLSVLDSRLLPVGKLIGTPSPKTSRLSSASLCSRFLPVLGWMERCSPATYLVSRQLSKVDIRVRLGVFLISASLSCRSSPCGSS